MTRTSRIRFQACTVAAVLGLSVLGTGTVVNSAGAAPISTRVPAADPIEDAVAADKAFVERWNEQRYDEILDLYAEDAILVPPNHDLIRGRQAIGAYIRTIRPLLGKLKTGLEPHRVWKSGHLTSILGNYEFTNGRRLTTSATWERRSDGGYKAVLDMFGVRDPL